MFLQSWPVAIRTDSGLCSQCQTNPCIFFWKKRSHKNSIGLNKRDNKRNGNRERLLLPSFEGINTMAPEKYKEEVWHCQKTSFFFTAKLLCYICEKRPGCIAYMWKYLPVVLPFSRGLHPSFFLTKWHSLIPKAAGWCASCLKIWQLWWSRRDFGIGPCPTGE